MIEFLSEYQVDEIIELVDFYMSKYRKDRILEELRISLPELGKVKINSDIQKENVCLHCMGTGKKND